MINLFINVMEQGFIFGLMALGVYLTYRILDFPDLSVDGTIVLGGAITASLIINQTNPILATFLAFIGGMVAGLATGILHVHLKISNLLSGILVMIGLYSINLRIMKAANLPLFSQQTIFTSVKHKWLLIILIVIGVKLILDWFLKTKAGMLLKTTGDNPKLVTALGVDTGHMKLLGLMLSNGLVALSGSLLSQYQRFSDVTSGSGTIVFGLAAVIIGQTILRPVEQKWLKTTTVVLFGAIIYKLVSAMTLNLGIAATDFKLISALLVIIMLAINNKKLSFKWKWKRPVLLVGEEVEC
jgi:putative tryptophan/tyrosine transport system permease protein